MKTKLKIGCFVAVVILVLVSFTGVVGYQTTKSSTIARASPLFSIRTQRAIDEESKDIACDYVGKGEESFLSIPKRDDRIEMFQKVLEKISKMDDNTFKRYLNLIVNQMQKNDKYDDVNINKVITTIHQLRNTPERTSVDYDNNKGEFTTDIQNNIICAIIRLVLYVIVITIFAIITILCPTIHVYPFCD